MDPLVLGHLGVACTDCNDIRKATNMFQNYKDDFGCYEVDNRSKYSICINPKDDFIYAENQHFGWDKLVEDDIQDLQTTSLKLVEDNKDFEILLNNSGHCNTASTNIEGNISSPFRQEMYEKNNGYVSLTISLLINSFDSTLESSMTERYECDQEVFEWLNIFHLRKRSRQHKESLKQVNLCEQLRIFYKFPYE